MNLGIIEGVLWLIMGLGLFGVAAVITTITTIAVFLCRNKFKLMFLALAGWVGWKLVKNSEKGDNIINAKVVKDCSTKVKSSFKKLLK